MAIIVIDYPDDFTPRETTGERARQRWPRLHGRSVGNPVTSEPQTPARPTEEPDMAADRKFDPDSLGTFAEWLADLAAAGYRPGPPSHVAADALQVDRDACRGMTCPGCSKRGLTAHPFHRHGRYKIIAACRVCKAGLEF